MSEVREPVKKTSKKTKQRIIEKGFELICKEGYHNITCADIAKYAEVSTGSIYQYFSNKKDILINGINQYLTEIMFPKIITQEKLSKEQLIKELINASIESHKKYKIQHEELVSIVHQDRELSKLYQEKEWEMTKYLTKYLEAYNIDPDNLLEKTHIILGLIDNLSHEIIYHKHKKLKEENLKKETEQLILKILT